ncbi:MAG: TIGR01440 family protein [Eubacterium sp.]|nr:TIGR01440 family protein [Eubacterium sp.]MCH4046499.1 TIGR01440 family protein [Eubacterium sp.]MCH4079594.1 TIGR01440 family protein [Eubacterium sp.]MCH4110153.1 TIGR01440 family protein [Eubacterium sp.]MCI1307415.1 TIGR01440 family protein [Eubacterium sp.]
MELEEIRQAAHDAADQLLQVAKVPEGGILVVGCSTSEVEGVHIGKGSNIHVAEAIYEGIQEVLQPKGIYLAAQCCEHLNRSIIIERAALKPWQDIVNVVPQPHAGGSFATTMYKRAKDPVAVEEIKADAGIDIGDTLIGMHLRKVAVPVRIDVKYIGKAHVVCARTRPKFVGGERAVYDKALSGGEVRDDVK